MNPKTYQTLTEAAQTCAQLAGDDCETGPDGSAVESELEGGWSFIPVDMEGIYWIERRCEHGNFMGYHGTD